MTWLDSIIYGFISGISEFLPVSSQAHQSLMLFMMGYEQRIPYIDLFTHIGALLGLVICCNSMLVRIRRDKVLAERSRFNRRHRIMTTGICDLRVIRTGMIPLLIFLLSYLYFQRWESSLPSISLVLILGGVIMLIPKWIHSGNKDSRMFSLFDSLGLGFSGALSAIPGLSRVGMMLSFSGCRGADRISAYNWILLLSIPALTLFTGFDIIHFFTMGSGGFSLFPALIALISSAIGGYLSIQFMRYILVGVGYSPFGFFSFGCGLFTFLIYLLT